MEPTETLLLAELDRQAAILLDPELVALLAMSEDALRAQVEVLRQRLRERTPSAVATGNIPLCLGVRAPSFPAADLMRRVVAKRAHGVVDMTPLEPGDFAPLDEVVTGITTGDVYLLLDVDTGRSRLNVSPEASLAAIRGARRTPLTLEEGVLLALFVPSILTDKTRYNAIQMPGSRRAGDQRVPSIWFSKGAPRLGWCWDRNVHTWLASASAATRIACQVL